MFGFPAMAAPEKADSQEIIKDNSPNLIAEPFVDSLARIQQEKNLLKQTAKDCAKRSRDRRLVATYLKSKFPDAFDKHTMTVPERDFPNLLKLAKRRYIGRIIAGISLMPVGIGGFFSINNFAPKPSLIGISILLLSLATVALGLILAAVSGIILNDGE